MPRKIVLEEPLVKPRKAKKVSKQEQAKARAKHKAKMETKVKVNPKFRDYTKIKPNHRLTPQLIQSLCEGIAAGSTLKTMCAKNLISTKTLYEWRTKGQEYELADEPIPEHKIFYDFVLALGLASADYHGTVDNKVHNDEDWQRWIRIAESRCPDQYGRMLVSEDSNEFQPDAQFL